MMNKLIRVTSVLSFIDGSWYQYWLKGLDNKGSPNAYREAQKISDDSAAFGTAVHKKIEGALKGEIVLNPESQDPQDQCAVHVIMWLEQNNIKPLFDTYEKSLEIEVKDEKLGLIGHFDYAANVNGVPTIVDFKTSGKMRKSFPLQKAAYAKMAHAQLGTKIDAGLTIRSHWNPDTQSVEFETKQYTGLMKKYWPLFKGSLVIWKYFNRAEK